MHVSEFVPCIQYYLQDGMLCCGLEFGRSPSTWSGISYVDSIKRIAWVDLGPDYNNRRIGSSYLLRSILTLVSFPPKSSSGTSGPGRAYLPRIHQHMYASKYLVEQSQLKWLEGCARCDQWDSLLRLIVSPNDQTMRRRPVPWLAGCELVYWASINEYNRRRSRNTTQLNHRMGW